MAGDAAKKDRTDNGKDHCGRLRGWLYSHTDMGRIIGPNNKSTDLFMSHKL